MTKEIKFKKDDKNIIITIPIDLIEHATNNHPDGDMLVINKHQLAQEVLNQLEHRLRDDDTGLTLLQELLDKAIIGVCEDGSECIEFKDED